MDLGWGGALILFWCGLLMGAVFDRFCRGELWACLLYPLLFVGLLDSFRIFYWSESRMLAPAALLFLVAAAASRLARRTDRDTRPAGFASTRTRGEASA
jgi:hypothetical protein